MRRSRAALRLTGIAVVLLSTAGAANAAVNITVPCNGSGGGAAGLVTAIKQANGSGGGTITLAPNCQYQFTTIDNYWFGANALPAIASPIAISGNGARLLLAPGLRARFFFVGANPQSSVTNGYVSPGAGALTLSGVQLTGGNAFGGSSQRGGAGAGLGGAVFNMGSLTVVASTLDRDVAQGGNTTAGSSQTGGGGLWQDAPSTGAGGGMGPMAFPGPDGGFPGQGGPTFAGGGGGLRVTESSLGGGGGGPSNGMGGGANGMGGDGSGSGGADSGPAKGGAFGAGGSYPAGGGGVGGGGARSAAGEPGSGGFGGGGGSSGVYDGAGQGGFGGGGGSSDPGLLAGAQPAIGGFGGGNGSSNAGGPGGGGAGMGGAIFNFEGSMTIENSTLTADQAVGGRGANPGAGVGGAVANLDGQVSIIDSTLTANRADAGGGAVASFGFDGARALASTVTISRSILSGSYGINIATPFPVPDIAANAPATVDGMPDTFVNRNKSVTHCASAPCPSENVDVSNHDIVGRSDGPYGDSTFTGIGGTIASPVIGPDPKLGALSDNGGLTPTEAPAAGSPALDAAGPACLPFDQRGVARPQGPACDIGAVELDLAPPAAPILMGTTPPSPGMATTISVAASAEPGTTVTLFTNATCSGPPVASAPEGSGVTVMVAPGSTTTFHARATRTDGKASPCSSSTVTYRQSTHGNPGPGPHGPRFTVRRVRVSGSTLTVVLQPRDSGQVRATATTPGPQRCTRARPGRPRRCHPTTATLGSKRATAIGGRRLTIVVKLHFGHAHRPVDQLAVRIDESANGRTTTVTRRVRL